MKIRRIIAATAIAMAALGVSAANAASTLNISYFDIANPGPGSDLGSQPASPTDFGVCCSSGPATSANIALGSGLGPNGLPIAGAGSDVVDLGPSNQIEWWSNLYGITPTGSGVVTLGYASNMFAPNSTGANNDHFYETAVLYGNLIGNGGAVSVNLTSDDDAFVYLNGLYVGGVPGVHAPSSATLNLGNLSGSNSFEVFYADRAQVEAYLSLDVVGAVTSAVPEPATWAMFLLGFGAIGWTLRSRRNAAATTA